MHFLEGPEPQLTAMQEAYPEICQRLGPSLIQLDFGNLIGAFDVPGLGLIEVASGKWKHRDFDSMLAELTEIAAGLPFAAGIGGALPYDRNTTAEKDVLYHAFVYVRYVLSETAPAVDRLLPAVARIIFDPHRRFEQIRRRIPSRAVRRVDARSLVGVLSAGQRLVRWPKGRMSRTYVALKGYLPEQIDEPHVEITQDTPENRFVKSFLSGVRIGVVEEMRRVAEGGGLVSAALASRISRDCEWMDGMLRVALQDSFWSGVGQMQQVPAGSAVLQARRGYRDVFRHFARLRLASRVPLKREVVQALLEGKDIALLYELWSYFAIVRALGALLGPPSKAARPTVTRTQVFVPWDLEVVWPDGTRLLYNARFSRSQETSRFSYSVSLRPDIALEVYRAGEYELHVFDAKFRLDRVERLFSEDDGEGNGVDPEIPNERRGTFNRGDLYKMHAYRDAIREAQSVWILYPGDNFRFFTQEGVALNGIVAGSGRLRGVGAIPMLPGRVLQEELQRVLRHLLGKEFEEARS